MEVFELKSLKRKQGEWILEVSQAGATFRRGDDSEQIDIPRPVLREECELLPVLGGQGVLVVRRGKRKLKFLLPPEQRDSLDLALGPETPESLRLTLKRRYVFCAPLAVLFVLTSLPLPGDESASLEAVPFSPLSLLLGIGLLGLWVHARFAPRPYLFAADSAWFLLLALSTVWDILQGWSSVWWLVWVVLLVHLASQGVRQYKRFRSVGSTPEAPEPAQ